MEEHGPKANDKPGGRAATGARRFTVGNSFDHDDQGVTLDSRNPASRPWHVRDNHDGRLVGRYADPADARALAGALNDLESDVAADERPQDPEELRRLADKDRWLAREADDSVSLDRRLHLLDLEEFASDAREAAAMEWFEYRDDVA